MQRKALPHSLSVLSAWHQEKLSRDQTVDKQQVPQCPCTFFETGDI